MQARQERKTVSGIFLCIQAVLYALILTTGGETLRWCEFAAIVLCLGHAALAVREGNRLVIGGLLCTVGADACLVLCSPIQRLWGMIFFLGAQALYAVSLHRDRPRWWLVLRLALTVAAAALTVGILREKTDALAVISVCYYGNLLLNLVCALVGRQWLPTVAFVLFLLCDTVIGLQVAAGAYLPIAEGSWMYAEIFCGCNLAWAFYLPSQVLLSFWAKKAR